MSNYQFEKEWATDDDSSRPWAMQGRRTLNRVIEVFNEWQLDGFPAERIEGVKARIEWGHQLLCDVDGGQDWVAALDRMKAFIDQRTA